MAVGAELSVVILWRFWISTLPDSFFPSPPPKKNKVIPRGGHASLAFLFWRPRASLACIRETTGPNLGIGSLEPILWRCAREKKAKVGLSSNGRCGTGRPAPSAAKRLRRLDWPRAMRRSVGKMARLDWQAAQRIERVDRECRFVWREPFCWALRPADRRGSCLRPEPIKAKRPLFRLRRRC